MYMHGRAEFRFDRYTGPIACGFTLDSIQDDKERRASAKGWESSKDVSSYLPFSIKHDLLYRHMPRTAYCKQYDNRGINLGGMMRISWASVLASWNKQKHDRYKASK